jgi:serine phosphatase RsbU (regulator of sigma subunit)
VTPDGATEFVIGDVSGHGPEAAALATALRASWGTLRRLGQPLEEMLAALDDVVVAERADDELFATVLVGRVSRTGALRVGSAGHPLPVVVGAEPREVAGRPGMLLGTGLEARRPVSEQQLDGPLLVYTDGLTDGRAEPGDRLRFGLDGLLAAVAEHASDAPEALIGSVIATATAAHGEPLADDVTVLLVGHDGGGP